MLQNAKATFDLSTQSGQIKAFNATQSSVSLKTIAGSSIEIDGILQYTDITEEYGAPQEVTITAFIGTDGIVYSSISSSVAEAGEKLLPFFTDLGFETLNIGVSKGKSKSDREYLSVSIVS